MFHFVVMEAQVGAGRIWAWCKVTDGPGFDDVTYTAQNGYDPVDLEVVPDRYERYLFTVPVDAESRIKGPKYDPLVLERVEYPLELVDDQGRPVPPE